jgi:hypothetical protein
LLNWRAFELARRKLEIAWDASKKRVAPNGFNDDLPADATWSLEKAMPRLTADIRLVADRLASSSHAATFPAATLLEETLRHSAASTRLIVIFMPSYMPPDAAGIAPDACKDRFADIVRKRDATMIDFMLPTAWTTNPSNYWDRLHFRRPIAETLPRRIRDAADDIPAPDGVYEKRG